MKVLAGYIAGLLHRFINKYDTRFTQEEIQILSAAEVLLVKKTKSEALLKEIK
jgi:hypothetical protein